MSLSGATARRLRRIAFLGVAAYMLLPPAYVQVFGGRSGTVRSWRMFDKRGEGICSAIYYQDGKRLDRYALLGEQRRTAQACVLLAFWIGPARASPTRHARSTRASPRPRG
jgi:hypothetical protein